MYKNIVTLKNGRAMVFETDVPFSIDKLSDEWNIIVDVKTQTTLSIKSSEVVTIASAEIKAEPKKTTRKAKIKTEITEG